MINEIELNQVSDRESTLKDDGQESGNPAAPQLGGSMDLANLESWIPVGKIRQSHGLKGELYAIIFSKDTSWLGKARNVVLERAETDKEGNAVAVDYPFEVRLCKPHKVGVILRVEGLKDRTQADEFQGAKLKVKEELLISKPGEVIYLREIEGFQVENRGEAVGPVVGFSSNQAQDLIVVETAKGRFEVPLVKEFVDKIDWAGRKLKMDLPVGLLGEEL